MTVASPQARQAAAPAAVSAPRRWLGPSDRVPSRGLVVLSLATAGLTYAVIVAGGVVRTTGSGLGCGAGGGQNDWPFCRGRLLPPAESSALIEFSHRWLVALLTVAFVSLLATAWARYRHLRALTWTVSAYTVFLVAQIALGAVTVLGKLPANAIMVHLANAELLLGCALLVCVLAATDGGRGMGARTRAATAAQRRAAGWALAAAAGTFVLVVSGAFVVDRGASASCASWPLCGNGVQLDSGRLATYNLGHRVVAALVTVLLGIAVMRGARAFAGVRALRRAGIAVGALLLAQIVAGAVLVESRLPAGVRSLHEALASALWGAVALYALLSRPGMLAGARRTAGAARRWRPLGPRRAPMVAP